METIFRSKAFYSDRSMRQLVKNPVEFVVGMLRQLESEQIDYGRVTARFLTGLAVLNYSDPDGLPDGTSWINSQNVINRANFAMEVIKRPTLRALRLGAQAVSAGLGRVPGGQPEPALHADRHRGLLARRARDGDVPAKVRTDLIDYMTRTDTGTRTWNPFVHPAEKVSGLVHLIMALPKRR
jgi:hypothetical protein